MRKTEFSPLIHCITNPISMMQCANTVIGLGGRPIMAEHPEEVGEITATADALLINLGNISDIRMEAMEKAYAKALEKDIPVVIDAVGVACSGLRLRFIKSLIRKKSDDAFLVIKGNYSEIMALCDEDYRSEGVDAKADITGDTIRVASQKLSEKLGAVILASGSKDVVSFGAKTVFINNGCPELSHITGTGCMLGAICATFLAVKRDMESVIDACAVLGIAGELAAKEAVNTNGQIGAGTFLIKLLDSISLISDETLALAKRIETT